MLDVLLWLVLVEVIGLASLPTAFLFFRWLPDRGYALTKALGLLLVGYGAWMLGMVLHIAFAAPTLWAVLAVILLVNLAILAFYRFTDTAYRATGDGLRAAPRFPLLSNMAAFYGRRVGYVVAIEAIFVVAVLLIANSRSYAPDIYATEKFMDAAFINSMLSSTAMPPADPWYSGLSINYYYFGHLIAAGLARMTGAPGSIAFNLDISLTFGLVASSVCGLAYNLVALAQGRLRRAGGAVVSRAGLLAGVLSAVFVLLLGNLAAAKEVLDGVAAAQSTGASFSFSWWDPSRVLWDCLPNVSGGGCTYTATINEFPAFSFLLADLHPHLMAMPFVLLAIGLALSLFLVPVTQPLPFAGRWPAIAAQCGLAGLVIGALFMLNTWDFPTFLLLACVAYALNRHRAAAFIPSGRRLRAWGIYALFAIGLAVLAVVAFAPFHLTFKAQLSDHYLPDSIANIPILHSLASSIGVSVTRSPLMSYWLIFGIFSAPLLAFWGVKIWPYLRDPYTYRYPIYSWGYSQKPVSDTELDEEVAAGPKRTTLWTGAVLCAVGLLLVIPEALGLLIIKGDGTFGVLVGVAGGIILAAGVGYVAFYGLDWLRPSQPTAELRLLTLLLGAVLFILSFSFLHFELFGPLYIILITGGLVLLFENRPADGVTDTEAALTTDTRTGDVRLADSFALAALMLMVLIDLTIEVIYLRDTFDTRMNSIFKFYFQTWIIFGLMTGYALWRVYVTAWTGRIRVEAVSAAPSTATGVTADTVFAAPAPALAAPADLYESDDYGTARRLALAVNAATATIAVAPAKTFAADAGGEDSAAEEANRAAPAPHKLWWRWLWAFAVALLILAGLAYPYLGAWDRTGQWRTRTGLDGMAWVEKGQFAPDYNAIVWLQNRLKADPATRGVIVEANKDDYGEYNLVSTFTGLPSIMGWPGHEYQWRAGDSSIMPHGGPSQIDRRVSDVKRIYSTTDIAEAKQLLVAYNVRYVYVGTIERGVSSASVFNATGHESYGPGVEKFGQFMQTVYNANGVTIYEWNPATQK